jgi:hypothetical protein
LHDDEIVLDGEVYECYDIVFDSGYVLTMLRNNMERCDFVKLWEKNREKIKK